MTQVAGDALALPAGDVASSSATVIPLWIAANELALLDELVPFLMARSGQAHDDFGRWVAPRRPLEWVPPR